jgi:hypothetical protein
VPVAGDALGVDDAKRSFEAGSPWIGAGELGLAALGVVPVVGDAAQKLGKKGLARALRSSPERVADTKELTQALRGPQPEAPSIKAYHGSPHDFDKFSTDAIGTGEGAQAYGHGLYFAENEGVARSYRDNLIDPDQTYMRINDKQIPSVWNDELRETFPEMYQGLSEADQDDMDALLGTMQSTVSANDAANAAESVGPNAKRLFHQRVAPVMSKPEMGAGSMYEVNINANPDDFLDWDAPLSEQSDAVKKILGSELEEPGSTTGQFASDIWDIKGRQGKNYETGEYFFEVPSQGNDVVGQLHGDPNLKRIMGTGSTALEAKSDAVRQMQGRDLYVTSKTDPFARANELRQAGIPGIKYYDGSSRVDAQSLMDAEQSVKQLMAEGAPQSEINAAMKNAEDVRGSLTRNYVVFDPEIIDIARKYGIAALVSGGLITQQMADQMREQGIEG